MARKSDSLIDLLIDGMLQMDPKKRLSADECLRSATMIPYKDHSFDNEGITQTQGVALQGEVSGSNASTLITRRTLQGQETLDGRSSKDLVRRPMTHRSKADNTKRGKPTGSSSDEDSKSSKRQRKTACPASPSRCHR